LSAVAPRASNRELRSILGCFLFSADDVFKPIGVLSGGERNRYALARMLMMPGNFMLLDEPTNHLDMRAKDVLLEALQTFSGTIVFVSHDRYFIDKLATRVFEVGDGAVHVFPGNYEDYIWRKEQSHRSASPKDGAPSSSRVEAPDSHPLASPKDGAPQDRESKRLNPIKLRQMQERCKEVEEEIEELESAVADSERALLT